MFKNKIQQASTLQQHGQFDLAADMYQSIIKVNAYHFDALQLWGALEGQRGNLEFALTLLNRALDINQNSWVALSNRANIHLQLGKLHAALRDVERAGHYNPQSADVHDTHGSVLLAFGRAAQAQAAFERAIELQSGRVSSLVNRASALYAQGRLEEASTDIHAAMGCGARAYPQAYVVFGNVLVALDRAQEAIEPYRCALALSPHFLPAHIGLGTARLALNELDEAAGTFAAARASLNASETSVQQIDAEHYGRRDEAMATLAFYEGMVHLAAGNLPKGWELYEQRWAINRGPFVPRHDEVPRWQGTSLRGKTILLHSEQGLGDTLQFVRYVPLIAAMGAKVVLVVQPPLVTLLSQLQGICTVVNGDDRDAVGAAVGGYDFCCPLMSLPRLLDQDMASLDNTPYLKASGMRREFWTHQINRRGSLSVGVVWQGSHEHQNDRKRSIPFSSFSQLLIEGADFHCLQIESLPDSGVRSHKGKMIRYWEKDIRDFTDTAEIISLLDLVITVDTSVAHLAGAMGKPVWLLVTYSPDWRWFLNRNDSPWYQKMRIFRQPVPGDWSSVLTAVRDALNEYRVLRGEAPRLIDGQEDFLA
ncbi:tetratricopeptide repeat protein [Burkholderia gladioli]|uniref:tetratricopeptide repeat protein n=1 Tax=Burkholderia gladioli TaxID=28095 RepID=UPI00163F16A5|nr:tetratricopeptide repeat protein [Burkholderia gladioli]